MTIATRLQKYLEVTHALVNRPSDVARWRATGRNDEGAAFRLGVPWVSFGATDLLAELATAESSILEYGAGGSTIFFARRSAKVTTLENDDAWLDRLRTTLVDQHLNNVTLLHRDFDARSPAVFEQSGFYQYEPEAPVDVVFIDSFDFYAPHDLRPKLFARALNFVEPGAHIVIDDSWRYAALRRTPGLHVRTESGVGPGRKWTTSTDFYTVIDPALALEALTRG